MMTLLPKQYQILPSTIDFTLRGFSDRGGRCLALRDWDADAWFEAFAARVAEAVDHGEYLPVCRMSDGEFIFALGDQPESVRLRLRERVKRRLRTQLIRMAHGGGFRARTRPGVSSGAYTREEWQVARESYPAQIRTIAEQGILALHLTFGPVPFQEQYFPPLWKWLCRHNIVLNDQNYFPFYFVYALLSGPRGRRIVNGRRLLIVNSANVPKRASIEASLYGMGAAEVHWHAISPDRSFFDTIDVAPLLGRVDLVFVGAGVGKPNVMLQLRPLGVPVIDAGYMIEVWSDSELASNRPFCRYGGEVPEMRSNLPR